MRPLFRLTLPGMLAMASACDEPGPPIPCQAVLPDHSFHVGESARVAPCFTSEALPLTYSAMTTDPAIVSVEVSGLTVVMSAEGVGQAIASVTATDANGKTATQNMRVVVPNRAPALVADLPLAEIPLWNVVELDLNDHVADPDREPLVFEARPHDRAVLEVEMRGDTLVLYAIKRGETGLDIVATDPQNEALALPHVTRVGSPSAYITQGSHSRDGDAPLVAGKPGLMRLFLVTDSFGVSSPDVTARILHEDGKVLERMLAGTGSVPADIDEGRLDRSYNLEIEPHHLLPNARLLIDIPETRDPDMARRIEMPLNVAEMPVLELTLVPVVFGSDRRAVETVAEIERNPEGHSLLYRMRTLLPVDDLVLRVHEPFYGNQDNLIREMAALWVMEGQRGIYLGIIPEPIGGGLLGQAYVFGPRAGFAIRSGEVIAHEMGHIFGLYHAPCGTSNPDPDYPNGDGTIGIWGYDFASGDLIRPVTYDLMSYCDPTWIGDYHFDRAIQGRISIGAAPPNVRREQVLAVQGRIDARGSPVLKPAFYTEGIPTRITGDTHEIAAFGTDGELFSYRFAPAEIMDGPGGASFFHLIPVTWGDEELTSIAFTAPNGEVSRLDRSTDHPYSIVMRDGQVESISYGPPPPVNSGARVLFSRGIPRR